MVTLSILQAAKPENKCVGYIPYATNTEHYPGEGFRLF